MHRKHFALLGLLMALCLALTGCGAAANDAAATARPNVTATAAPAVTPGAVTDGNGIIGDEDSRPAESDRKDDLNKVGDDLGDAARNAGEAVTDTARGIGDAAADTARGAADAIDDMTDRDSTRR